MRIKLTIEYDGTAYCGWQRQNNALSVQQVIEQAIEKLTGEKTVIAGSGRTDAGVHALGQIAHFDTQSSIPAEKWSYALNAILPADIRIKCSCQVSEDFHARKSAKVKHYRYTVYNNEQENAVFARYSWHVRGTLDAQKMREAARLIEGEHDFASFCAAGSTPVLTTVRTVYECCVSRKEDYITIDVKGNGFLYNMVRIIAGTLVQVGKGKLTNEDVLKILDAKDRATAPVTAPAKGLMLVSVEYPQ